MFLGQL